MASTSEEVYLFIPLFLNIIAASVINRTSLNLVRDLDDWHVIPG